MNNDSSDKNLQEALDDIFGTDFIEIDMEENNKTQNHKDSNDSKAEEKKQTEKKEQVEKPVTITKKIKKKKTFKKNNNSLGNKAPYILSLIVLLVIILALGIVGVVKYYSNKIYVANCSYKATTNDFELTDEYKITYLKNQIQYLEGKYNFRAKTDDYKNQIDVIREEKLPVIINSNGMSGFTYIYELGTDFFSVDSYLDFLKFDYNIIDKNDNKNNPISYIPLNSKTTYKSLIKNLEKDGYICTKSK